MTYSPGGIVGGGEPVQARSQGLCPLDGYPLVEFLDHPLVPGGWEHIIPANEINNRAVVLGRIAEAHAFETVAAAEQTSFGDEL